ncbi:transcription factor TFIIIB subunit brf1 [Rhodotorula kratochvilovae]
MICSSCGEDSVVEMDAQTVCTTCGTVMAENGIVSEITFGETSGGAAMVQGSYVGADQTRARAPAGYRQRGIATQESREQTLMNGRRRIFELATGLRLSEHLSNVATRFFNLAVNMNFTKGRRTQYVAAACLYAACRQANGTQMLIDFSDLIEINVFVLGSTYLKLVRELNINIPIIDPVIYITRFAALLDFGEETQKVALDATRLVNRMGRDWMQIGRRPSGICGACLLLAARMNNFRRSIEEIVQVVKIADVTLRKRLAEFKETASGSLTVADFRSIWLEETQDPPAYTQGIKREEKQHATKNRKAREDTGASEMESVVGERAFRELADREATAEADDDEGARGGAGSGKENEPEVEGDMAPPPLPSAKALGKRKRADADDADDARAPRSSSQAPGSDEDEEPEQEEDLAEEVLEGQGREEYEAVMRDEMSTYLGSTVGSKLAHELDQQDAKRLQKASQSPAFELDTSDRLDDLDEDELDAFILGPDEVEIKSRLWMEANKDYLRELADKQTGPDGELKPISRRPRKRTKPRDGQNATGLTAADATTKMLEKKKFSKKINYDAIRNLFDAGSDAGSTYGGRTNTVNGDEEDEPLIGRTYGPSGGARRKDKRARSTVGTPIVTPEPTWRQGSRAPSESPSLASARGHRHEPEPEEEEEPDQAQDDDENAWRSQFATTQDDGAYDGYDEL